MTTPSVARSSRETGGSLRRRYGWSAQKRAYLSVFEALVNERPRREGTGTPLEGADPQNV